MRWIWSVVMGIACAGCAIETPAPTAPTAVVFEVSPYQWELTAPGCHPERPAPALTQTRPDQVIVDRTRPGATSAIAQYKDGPERGRLREQDYIFGTFYPYEKVWALCEWARYTRSVIP